MIALAAISLLSCNAARSADPQLRTAEGWRVQSAAIDGLMRWPVVADWDAAGRLVVVESGGVARPIEQHNQQRLHKIVRLSDSDGDGVFDQRLIAADGLPFTEGVLCLGDAILAAAPPVIWKLQDADGDGVCERREVWFDGGTITGCANDLHGPYLGRDGWVYWCKGAFAEQTHALADGRLLKDKAAHLFRRRPEGGPIEVVISGGMDNPVEVAMTVAGDVFFTSTFLVHPGDGQRDGIGHAIEGAVFGKPHSVLDAVPKTGELMPPLVHLGPAAPSGLIAAEHPRLIESLHQLAAADDGEGRPSDFLIAALFNLHKLTVHPLRPNRSTVAAGTIELLVSDQVDFHPTDVIEDRDGSLLVLDTGGWYDLCCPTSRVDQRIAPGGIYRLIPPQSASAPAPATGDTPPAADTEAGADAPARAAGSAQQAAVEGTAIERWSRQLGDPRPWYRRTALGELRRSPEADVPSLAAIASGAVATDFASLEQETVRRRAAWALVAADSESADAALLGLTAATDPIIRRISVYGLGLHRRAVAVDRLAQVATNASGALARGAVEALGRVAAVHERVRPAAVSAILAAAPAADSDVGMQHAIIYALRSAQDAESVSRAAAEGPTLQRWLAYRALATMPGDPTVYLRTTRDMLGATDPRLQSAALDVLANHSEWSASMWDQVQPYLAQALEEPEQLDAWFPVLRAWRDRPELHRWCEQLLRDALRRSPPDGLERLLTAWSEAEPPPTWADEIVDLLRADPPRWQAVIAGWDMTDPSMHPVVELLQQQLARAAGAAERMRVVAALPPGTRVDDAELVGLLIEQDAWPALSKLSWSPAAARTMLKFLEEAQPLQLPHLIRAVASCGDSAIAERLLRALPSIPAARTLPDGFLNTTFRRYGRDIENLAQEVDHALRTPAEDIARQVAQTLDQLPEGDPLRGLQVFRSSKAACSACHQLGYLGGRIGPELTRIGRSRTRAALLEAILFPSSRIEQSFVPMQVLTSDGQVLNGLVVSEDAERIRLQVAADRVETVDRSDILMSRPGTTSIMPGGLQQVLSLQEIADLLALLESSK